MRRFQMLLFPLVSQLFVSKKAIKLSQDDNGYTYNDFYYKRRLNYDIDPETLIFGGNSNQKLAQDVAQRLGVQLGQVVLKQFSDGECNIQILENVRGRNVYIIQSTSPPVNDNIMELLLFVSALRRSSAKSITVIVPYYGYSRQDHKLEKSQSIAAADIARLLESSGIDHLVSVDLHRNQIQAMFSPQVPVDNLSPYGALVNYLNNHPLKLQPPNELILVSPDFNGVTRVKKVQDVLKLTFPNLKTKLALIYKSKSQDNPPELSLVGDVSNKNCLIVDDIVDSATTLTNAAQFLKQEGAKQVMAFATHPVLSGKSTLKIALSDISAIYFTDTIQIKEMDKTIIGDKLNILNIAPLIAETIYRLQSKQSLYQLLSQDKI